MLNEKAAAAEAILDRAGLSIELLDETPEDAQRAKLIDFGPDYEQKILHAHSKPLFEKEQEDRRHIVSSASQKGKLKSQQAVEKTKENLQKDLMRNTRAAIDPFLGQHDRPRPGLGIKILKRKARDISSDPQNEKDVIGVEKNMVEEEKQRTQISLGLDYSSE